MSKCLSLEPQRPLSHLGYTAKMKILAGVHCAATIWCSSFQGGRETFLDGDVSCMNPQRPSCPKLNNAAGCTSLANITTNSNCGGQESLP
ncbi:uncharacterized protein PADG_11265 [Paracoccidioides brasiliensis Pb18]|uniref:Uncharacterized protein n=1 Tax=Paracoccidioides brasiliensis (strain Pb18) TaxID=502780 RepID=A0A0A0HTA8_PARBD|nr:uncharacterized protein PADG_11265 [Paracoccidioides brasiliensis Pb18]KGM92449.1 hypothetical protein PADG_11265 [Paracoccidioides brasiliensis Pb18]